MLEICTHKFLFFKRKEFWFYTAEKICKGTYNVFCYSNEKNASAKKNVLKEQTSLINLKKTNEELFNQINSTFKRHIQRAEKTGITVKVDYTPTVEKCHQIINEFSGFASHKKIAWNPRRIRALQQINKLIISEAFYKDKKLVTHVYLHDTSRVVLLHSYHQNKNEEEELRGVANKFLHWQDISNFKSYGLELYDFGGINIEQHPGISSFKLAFGGNVVDGFSYIETSPLLERLIDLYKRLRK